MLLLAISVAACFPSKRDWPSPVLEPRASGTVLPIVDPLGGERLAVEGVRVRARAHTGARILPGQEAPVPALIDSGASQVALPWTVAKALALHIVSPATATVAGGGAVGLIVDVPELALGDATVRGLLAVALSSSFVLVGQPILRQAPWEVDWGRGTVTLGAAAWPNEEGAFSVPFVQVGRFGLDQVPVLLNGQPASMIIDTGASVSAIPPALGRALGLTLSPYHQLLGSAAGVLPINEAYTADLSIGAVRMPGHRFVALPTGSVGLLGLDVLSGFDLLVSPGRSLSLRPRADVRATRAARIARWGWLPECTSLACVRARIEPAGQEGRLELFVEAALPRPVQLVLSCAEPAERIGGTTGRTLQIEVDLFEVKPGPSSVDVPLAGSDWYTPDGMGCRDLEVLDVVPALFRSTRDPWIQARLVR